eukprot:3897575-Pyramimonas_sp.AAC.1
MALTNLDVRGWYGSVGCAAESPPVSSSSTFTAGPMGDGFGAFGGGGSRTVGSSACQSTRWVDR